jgi:FkbM family methyltransferase
MSAGPPELGPRRERLRNRIEHWRLKRRLAGPKLLRAFAAEFPSAFFIEIGSNDGEYGDPLRPLILSRQWSGVMVEPVPHVFERLRANYAALDRIAFENAAITDHDGEVPFYHLSEAEPSEPVPEWYDAIGSVSRAVVRGSADEILDLDRRLVSTTVPSMTFESLCRKHHVRELDLLLIDTEGYDHELLRQIDLSVRRPTLLIYEHFHLLADQRADCQDLVRGAGYELMEEGFDTYCILATASERLKRAWRGLRPAVPGLSVHELRSARRQRAD